MHPLALDNGPSLARFVPELVLTAGILAVILWDLAARGRARAAGAAAITFATLCVAGGRALYELSANRPAELLFGGMLATDRFALAFRAFFAIVTAIVVLFSLPEDARPAVGRARAVAEYYALLLTVALGMNLMSMSHSLLMIYLSLELVSVMSFVLAGYDTELRRSAEAALKYVVFGGVASGILLYGASWLYGVTQSLDLATVSQRVAALTSDAGRVPAAVIVGVVCMLAGFGYKISAAPFHMWTPDVYEGAPTPVTAFLSVGPKAAGFAVLVRFFAQGLSMNVGGAGDVAPWPVLGGLLAVATMVVGNLSALGQTSVKRMLAYSSIAHAGYILLGFCVFSDAGTTAILFYLATYCLMNLGAFLVVLTVAKQSAGEESLDAFAGLGTRSPALAASMAVFLFSLTGLPPFAGFVGKFYLFAALLSPASAFRWLLAAVGVLNSVVALFYYVRVMRAMYIAPASREGALRVPALHGVTLAALTVPTIALGVYWGPLYDFIASSITMAR